MTNEEKVCGAIIASILLGMLGLGLGLIFLPFLQAVGVDPCINDTIINPTTKEQSPTPTA